MACPASPRLSAGAEDRPTEWAAEGTAAHTLASTVLSDPHNLEAVHFIGHQIPVPFGADVKQYTVDAEMAEAVDIYCDVVRTALANDPTALLHVETRFDIRELLGVDVPMFGTADAVVIHADRLEIFDLKFGKGVVVEAKGNAQLRYYALGAWFAMGRPASITKIQVSIVQPRAAHADGCVRTEVLDILDLIAWSGTLRDAVLATQAPDAPIVAGTHCRFCPVKLHCPGPREQAALLAQREFGDGVTLGPPVIANLTPDEVGAWLYASLLVEDWIAALRAHAHELVERGETIPGWKAVPKRARRFWTDEAALKAWLFIDHRVPYDKVFESELRSPAQLEKLIPRELRKELKQFMGSKSSGKNLAPETDARPALQLGPQHEFTDWPEGQAPG